MKRTQRLMAGLTTVVCFFMLSSCSKTTTSSSQKSVSRSNFSIQYHSNSTDESSTISLDNHENVEIHAESFSQQEVSYSLSGGEAFQLVSLTVTVDTSKLQSQDADKIYAKILIADSSDINGTYTYEAPYQMADEIQINRVVKLNAFGETTFSVVFGEKKHFIKGDLIIKQLSAISISKDERYICMQSQDQTVTFVLFREDALEYVETLKACLEKFSLIRSDLKKMTGGFEPSDDGTCILFTENISYTALAGDPIYINHAEVADLFARMEENQNTKVLAKDDFFTIICHEMSHTFDVGIVSGGSTYAFDREFFAILKEVVCLKQEGYVLNDSFFEFPTALKEGIYNYESLAYVVTQTIEENCTVPEDAVREIIISLKSEALSLSVPEQFSLFVNVLSDEIGLSTSEIFTSDERETLSTYFECQ